MTKSEGSSQRNNAWSNWHFAIAMGGIIAVSIAHHWLSVIYFRYARETSNIFGPRSVRILKSLRCCLSRKAFGSPFIRLLLYAAYWVTNWITLLTDVELNAEYVVAKRLGWISVANLALLVFLSVKNTLLAPLAGQSYDKIRPLHKTAGYTCIVTSLSHGILRLSKWSMTGLLYDMRERNNLTGAIGGLAMVIISLSTVPWIMSRRYEVFYLIHIICSILVLITIGMHRPSFSTPTLSIIIFTASIWMYDRILRAGKLCWTSFGNYAIITPLPNNAVLLKLRRPLHARPGSHAFLWIPSIRWFETHPFTMASTNPVHFVIRAHNGFTRDLHDAALSSPGRSLRCAIDGGYGQVPKFGDFEKVILVAGGSGASFTIPVALDLIMETGITKATKSIDFIWIVRHYDTLHWFKDELRLIKMSPMANLLLYVTREPSPSPVLPQDSCCSDIEKGHASGIEDISWLETTETRGPRPSIADLIDTAVASTNSDNRIIVGVCGPEGMIDQTREAISKDTRENSPCIELYTEGFKC